MREGNLERFGGRDRERVRIVGEKRRRKRDGGVKSKGYL